MAHAGGRPRKYNGADDFDNAIQHYFDTITKTNPVFESRITGYKDKEKTKPIFEQFPVLNNAGEQVENTTYYEIPSITGLCLHIGISAETWNEYSKKEEFSEPIMRAKKIIEKYNVEQLYRKEQVNGIMFNLKNNFGWVDKQEIDNTIRNPEGESFRIDSIDQANKIIADLSSKFAVKPKE
jgi:hypothetical protein